MAGLRLPAEFPAPSRPRTQTADEPRPNIVSNGTVALGRLDGSVAGFDRRIERDAIVEGSVSFSRVPVGRGAEVRRAILDKGVQVRPGAMVGCDREADRARGLVLSEGGVTCVPEGTVVEAG